MSENDYIAEYIREKYPKLLGIEYVVWKMARMMGDYVGKMAASQASIGSRQHKKENKEGED